MNRQQMLNQYAEVLVRVGVNLQKGQGLHVTLPAEGYELARAVSSCAYRAGASAVAVRFTDECLDELDGACANQDELLEYVKKEYETMTELSDKDYCFLRLYAPTFSHVIEGKEALYNRWAGKLAGLQSMLRVHTAGHGWMCIACCPTLRWAQKVFPDLTEQAALEKLWGMLFHMTRSDTENPIDGWIENGDKTIAQGQKMTAVAFDSLHIVGPGTDLRIGLIPSHIWGGGRFPNKMGIWATPNIPTEELATTPDKYRVDGWVSSVRPFVFRGEIIDKFRIRFENGVAVEWYADVGEAALTSLIHTDENACRLGEVAIVPAGGLIGSTNTVYYCTLLDENATCHLALGAGFPMHIRDAAEREKVNTSIVHEDFMIGNDQLMIYGIDKDGSEKLIFNMGHWAI